MLFDPIKLTWLTYKHIPENKELFFQKIHDAKINSHPGYDMTECIKYYFHK